MRKATLTSFASPFLFPRVSGAEIIGACASTAQRLSSTDSVQEQIYIRADDLAVTFNGEQPFATYTRVGGRGNKLCLRNGRINLPYVDSMMYMPRKTANQWVGYVAHELLHIVFTSDSTWNRASWRADRKGKPVKGWWFKTKLLNGLEDPRIEACGARIGFAPGAQFCIRALVQDMIERAKQQPIEKVCSIRNFPWILAVGLRGYDVGEKEIIAALPKDLAKVYKFAAKKYAAAMKHPDFDSPEKGTTLMLRIATAVQRKLKELAEEHEEEQPTPPDQPTPSEDGDESEEREDGEGDGEQDGDEGDGGDESDEDEGDGEEGEDADESDDGSGNDEGADNDGEDSEEFDDERGGGGYSKESKRYENPDDIHASPESLPVEPAPQMNVDDSAIAMGRDFAVYVIRKS